jgi:hypothetical protein
VTYYLHTLLVVGPFQVQESLMYLVCAVDGYVYICPQVCFSSSLKAVLVVCCSQHDGSPAQYAVMVPQARCPT